MGRCRWRNCRPGRRIYRRRFADDVAGVQAVKQQRERLLGGENHGDIIGRFNFQLLDVSALQAALVGFHALDGIGHVFRG